MFSSHSISTGNVPIVEILCPQRVGRASSKYITHLCEKILRSQVWNYKARKPRNSEAGVQSHKHNCSKQEGKKASWGKFSTRVLV